jgi:hypothetical protein
MPKRRERSSDEYYRGIIREKDKLIKSLQRRVKHLEKREHLYEDPSIDVIEDIQEGESCPRCSKGELREIDLKHIIIVKCNSCEYNEKRKSKKG